MNRLTAVLFDNTKLATIDLDECWSNDDLRIIRAMKALHAEGQGIDPITLAPELARRLEVACTGCALHEAKAIILRLLREGLR